MSSFRPLLRGTALSLGLLLPAVGLSVTTTASAAPAAPRLSAAQQSAVAATLQASADAAARAAGYAPPGRYVPYAGPRFGYLKRGKAEQSRIRNQVLATINSTWGGPRDRYGLPLPTNGRIRIATWSFGDKGIARALVRARNRGVSVQVMAARKINKTHPEWRWLQKRLKTRYFDGRVAGSSERISFARSCPGSCRGRGGTPHSKFFLFDNVGANHTRYITFQSSMNLTSFAWHGQWNQAQVTYGSQAFSAFSVIFREMRPATYVGTPFREYPGPAGVVNVFFPLGRSLTYDPVLRMLNQVKCTDSGVFNGRTRIRVEQYAIYQSRGEAIARKLRQLWQAGCDVAIIYAVTTRPALSILRSGAGRGPIPMKQSIIRGGDGTIVKYNHSKWMTIVGNYGGKPAQSKTISGSANWANLSMSSDEQMQVVDGYTAVARLYNDNFATTWAQRTSGKPTLAYIADARVAGVRGNGRVSVPLPENDIPWGKGVYKHMTEGG